MQRLAIFVDENQENPPISSPPKTYAPPKSEAPVIPGQVYRGSDVSGIRRPAVFGKIPDGEVWNGGGDD